MKSTLNTYSMYDLSNPHFENVEILTKAGKVIKGQFVQFKVLSGNIEYLYPAEKYCFLPEQNKRSFWETFNANDGEFKSFPSYIEKLGLNDIERISITPVLVAKSILSI